ncbi:MAG TPA: TerC family protein [Verrucomicrobiae bacterium]|nr:TerC family protein [Verrucomicrobiae bacterium]
MELAFLSSLVSIIFINIILSGDNALVIAMATLNLEPKHRRQAVFWGTFGAVGLRIALTAVAAYLLTIPYLRAVGGLMLAWIALKLLREEDPGEHKEAPGSLREAIQTIIIADFLMSLDNVLAVAGAAKGNMMLLILGLVLSIPLVIWGSTLISKLMTRWPWLVSLGAGLLGWTAGEMIIQEPFLHFVEESTVLRYAVPLAIAIAIVIIGNLTKKDQDKPAETVPKDSDEHSEQRSSAR